MTKLSVIFTLISLTVLKSGGQTDAQLRNPEYLVDQYNQLVAKHNALIEKTRSLLINQSKEGVIEWIQVNDYYIGNGLAKFLLILAATFMLEIGNVETITLDDMSDRAWSDSGKNLYINLGFYYIDEKPFPEMESKAAVVSSKWNDLLKDLSKKKSSIFKTKFDKK